MKLFVIGYFFAFNRLEHRFNNQEIKLPLN